MIVTKCGKPTRYTDKQFRGIVDWKSLKDTAEELGLTPAEADRMRQGYRYKQVPNDERVNSQDVDRLGSDGRASAGDTPAP